MINDKSLTVRDIAKEACVSVATVSRVLNNSDSVSKKTAEKVQNIIDKFDFRPNALARSLYKKETKIIGCILPDITNYYFAKMFLEIEKQAHSYGYSMFLCNSMNDLELETMYLNTLEEHQVDGVIFMGGRVNEINPNQKHVDEIRKISEKCPLIVINGYVDDDNAYMIMTDDNYAIDRVVKMLVDNGNKKIGFIGGYENISVTYEKVNAFNIAKRKYGLNEEDTFIQFGGLDSTSGYNILKELKENNKMPQALITINDEVAVGVLHACLDYGIKVPDDISVCGYDNVSIAGDSYPMLTTFSHPFEEIGENALKTLKRLMDGKDAVNSQLLRGKIIMRESVKTI